MPPTNPGVLGEDGTLGVTALLLQINGARPGPQALTARVETPINTLLRWARSGACARSRWPRRRRGGAGAPMVVGAGTAARGGRGGEPNRGVTVPGEVRNYVPVTPEMLKNPPPGDWLIFRRNYQGQSHSPLNQITPANVKNLQLQWVWAMNDSGANQTTPIVHNGIIYLATPSNIVQALDGKTGSLIWETRAGPDQAPGYGGIRSIAIADDKIFLPASNAHMVALSARNGEILWDTNASPDATRVNTSGAIVIGNKVLQGLTGCTRFDGVGCFISAYDINTGKQAWRFYTVPREGEPGSETWGKLPMTFRGGGDTWIAGSYDPDLNLDLLGRVAGEAVELPEPEADAARQDALREHDRRAEPRHGQACVALPARAGRVVRSRRSVRARARRHRRSESLVQRREGRRPLEARSPHRPVPRLQGNGLSERLRPHRSENRRPELSPGHSRDADRQADLHLPEHRGRQELAGDDLLPACGIDHCAAQPVVHGLHGAERRVDRRRRRLRRRPSVQALAEQQGADRQARGLRRARRCRRCGSSSSARPS